MSLQDLRIKFSSYSTFAKNSTVLFVGTMIASVLNYVFHVVIGRFVSVETYGEAEALISIINIVSVPAMTLAMVATKYAASCSADGDAKGSYEILRYLNKKVFQYSLPIFLLAVAAIPFVGGFLNIDNSTALVLLWIAMLLSFFSAITSGILRGWQKFKDISSSNVWGAAIKLIFGIFLVKIGFGLNGIVGSIVLGTLASYVATILALRFIHAKEKTASAKCENTIDFKSLRRYVIPVFVGNLAITILGNGDMILAKHNLDALEAGQYGALTVVSKVIFFATGIIGSVLFSMSAENSHKGRSSMHILKTALVLVLGASGAATLIYFMYPAFVLSLLFGNKYSGVASYLGWFAIAVGLFSVVNIIFQYLLSIRRTKISYTFLAVAGIMLGAIFLYGKNISSILAIIIISQIIAIIISLFFLLAGKKGEKIS
ncbi:MAG TPA: hypothetical protein DIC35_05230 [Candidatus Moranbacteria bacterium]|nr:hypothetical protein [Candidatus Moranbacteria bacterium]